MPFVYQFCFTLDPQVSYPQIYRNRSSDSLISIATANDIVMKLFRGNAIIPTQLSSFLFATLLRYASFAVYCNIKFTWKVKLISGSVSAWCLPHTRSPHSNRIYKLKIADGNILLTSLVKTYNKNSSVLMEMFDNSIK